MPAPNQSCARKPVAEFVRTLVRCGMITVSRILTNPATKTPLARRLVDHVALLNARLGGANRPHCDKSHSYRRADAAPLVATNDSTGKNCRMSLNTAKWRGGPEREEYLRCVVPKTCSRRTQSLLPHSDENSRRVKKSSKSQKPSVRTHRRVCHGRNRRTANAAVGGGGRAACLSCGN